jgi:hypothetical protein
VFKLKFLPGFVAQTRSAESLISVSERIQSVNYENTEQGKDSYVVIFAKLAGIITDTWLIDIIISWVFTFDIELQIDNFTG